MLKKKYDETTEIKCKEIEKKLKKKQKPLQAISLDYTVKLP